MELDDDVIDEFFNYEMDVEWDVSLQPKNVPTGAQRKTGEPSEPSGEHLKVLSRCFGHKSFRPFQWEIINSLINERRDNCAIMATGYGKSLCYQFPSVYCGGVSIIVSPLISLMEDQILAMKMMDIPACLLGTAQTKQAETIEKILNMEFSLVYVTPEFCTGECGRDLLEKMNEKLSVTLIAVDEAHCVSTWGHDFRFQYQQLGILRSIFPNTPILAVSATATPKVRDDIIEMLRLRNPQRLCTGFDRPNLYFAVYPKTSLGIYNDLRKVMHREGRNWKFSGSTIIYAITRKDVERIAELLQGKELNCLPYHAGLPLKVRKETHEMFVRDKIDVIVATIAFGMGIDKPDVRNIIHYGSSASIEAYYQEVGRAGRDGQEAQCITFFSNHDFVVLRKLRENSYGSEENKKRQELKANEMLTYLNTDKCRRQYLLSYFESSIKEDISPRKNCCDNCTKRNMQIIPDHEKYEGMNEKGLYDFTEDAFTLMSVIDVMGGKYGVNMYILFIRGSQSAKLYDRYKNHILHGSGKHKTEEWWKALESLLETNQYITKRQRQGDFHGKQYTVELTEKGQAFITSYSTSRQPKILLRPDLGMFKLLKRKIPDNTEWTLQDNTENDPTTSRTFTMQNIPKEVDKKLYRLLLNKRMELASDNDCMPYMIASNEAVLEMASHKPVTLLNLKQCQLSGFTEAKANKFGQMFVELIRSYLGLDSEIFIDSVVKKTVKDILEAHPLPNTQMNPSAAVTWSMFSKGVTIDEIVKKRKFVKGTILTHLITAMKCGYPIKLADVEVSDKDKRTIMNAIGLSDLENVRYSQIKDRCPPEISFDKIKCVFVYMQIREHLKKVNIPYIEFENEPYKSPWEVESESSDTDLQEIKRAALAMSKEEIACYESKQNEMNTDSGNINSSTIDGTSSINNKHTVVSESTIVSHIGSCRRSGYEEKVDDDYGMKDINALLEAAEKLLNSCTQKEEEAQLRKSEIVNTAESRSNMPTAKKLKMNQTAIVKNKDDNEPLNEPISITQLIAEGDEETVKPPMKKLKVTQTVIINNENPNELLKKEITTEQIIIEGNEEPVKHPVERIDIEPLDLIKEQATSSQPSQRNIPKKFNKKPPWLSK